MGQRLYVTIAPTASMQEQNRVITEALGLLYLREQVVYHMRADVVVDVVEDAVVMIPR